MEDGGELFVHIILPFHCITHAIYYRGCEAAGEEVSKYAGRE